jgi:hypothetical protein
MKKMRQKKKGKRAKKASKSTIIPKMSASRQNYIRRFRRNIIRRANETLREELRLNTNLQEGEEGSQRPHLRRKMTIDDGEAESNSSGERRVRFDEESN